MKKIVAIVPTHGAGQAFVECIESLVNQTYPIEKIIVIDNNVKDGSVQSAKTKFPQLEVHQFTENRGVTGGRNAGIQHLPSDYDAALFVDHDMIAESTMLQELVDTLERHPNAGILTPKIYYHDQKNIIWAAGTDINLTTGQTIFYGGEDNGQYDIERVVAVAPATFLVTKAVIDKVGQFDDRYFATYEDTDFCFAARQAGFETWYSPKAITYHKIPHDSAQSMTRLLERTYYVGRNRYLFLRKFKLMNPISYLFIPVYILYYTKLALQYKNKAAIQQYLKGLYEGLTTKI